MKYDPLISPAVNSSHTHPQSYWRANFTPVDTSPLRQDISCEVAIIGAGYTGLSAACELAKQSIAVAVVDSHSLGFGCSGRNAGFVLTGTGRLSLTAIAKKWGDSIARQMLGEYQSAVAQVESLIDEGTIDCDLSVGEYYKIAHNPSQAATLASAARTNAAHFNMPGQFLDKAELEAKLGVQNGFGATVQPGKSLHPLKLIDGYARLAITRGAKIYGATPAASVQKQGAGYRISTPTGTIRANTVLFATNAYSPRKFHPLIDKRQFPVQSSILVTSPLSASLQQELGLLPGVTAMDTRLLKYYYRVLPDGRMLFGGRGAVSADKADLQPSRQRLEQAMQESFRQLKGVTTDFFWSGWVSVSLDSMPRVYFDTNTRIGYAMGYCGSGVSFATLAGTRLAQMATGQKVDKKLPIYQGELPVYPFPALRRMGLRALYTWARLTGH